MSVDGITGSDGASRVRSAQSAAAGGGVLATLATQPRFDLPDAIAVSGRPAPSRRDLFEIGAGRDEGRSGPLRDRPAQGDGLAGRESGGTLSAFVAQSLAQDVPTAETSPAAERIRAGIDAYTQASGSASSGPDLGVEILFPPGGVLASGHSLDLAV